jgi:hypothetical protein
MPLCAMLTGSHRSRGRRQLAIDDTKQRAAAMPTLPHSPAAARNPRCPFARTQAGAGPDDDHRKTLPERKRMRKQDTASWTFPRIRTLVRGPALVMVSDWRLRSHGRAAASCSIRG